MKNAKKMISVQIDADLHRHVRDCYAVARLCTGCTFSHLISVALKEFFDYDHMSVRIGEKNEALVGILAEHQRMIRNKRPAPEQQGE